MSCPLAVLAILREVLSPEIAQPLPAVRRYSHRRVSPTFKTFVSNQIRRKDVCQKLVRSLATAAERLAAKNSHWCRHQWQQKLTARSRITRSCKLWSRRSGFATSESS